MSCQSSPSIDEILAGDMDLDEDPDVIVESVEEITPAKQIQKLLECNFGESFTRKLREFLEVLKPLTAMKENSKEVMFSNTARIKMTNETKKNIRRNARIHLFG